MTSHIAHVAINADDLEATRTFYESVAGWRFDPWGPPGFYRTEPAEGPLVALQARRTFADGTGAPAEITLAVDDVAAAIAAAVAAGGRVLMDPTVLAGVGELAFVADPSGTPVGLMRFDPAAE